MPIGSPCVPVSLSACVTLPGQVPGRGAPPAASDCMRCALVRPPCSLLRCSFPIRTPPSSPFFPSLASPICRANISIRTASVHAGEDSGGQRAGARAGGRALHQQLQQLRLLDLEANHVEDAGAKAFASVCLRLPYTPSPEPYTPKPSRPYPCRASVIVPLPLLPPLSASLLPSPLPLARCRGACYPLCASVSLRLQNSTAARRQAPGPQWQALTGVRVTRLS